MGKLKIFQQGELDAVLMYRRLTELTDREDLKEAFKNAAADEGKHASIIKTMTGLKLTARPTMKAGILLVQKCLGWKCALYVLSFSEKLGGHLYKKPAQIHPVLEEVRQDEYKHSGILKEKAKNTDIKSDLKKILITTAVVVGAVFCICRLFRK